jgi:hypothetical protein
MRAAALAALAAPPMSPTIIDTAAMMAGVVLSEILHAIFP